MAPATSGSVATDPARSAAASVTAGSSARYSIAACRAGATASVPMVVERDAGDSRPSLTVLSSSSIAWLSCSPHSGCPTKGRLTITHHLHKCLVHSRRNHSSSPYQSGRGTAESLKNDPIWHLPTLHQNLPSK